MIVIRKSPCMLSEKNKIKDMKFHFSGICGAGMGNVALLCARAGHQVKGSDQNAFPPMSDLLAQEGIPVFSGYEASHVEREFTPDVQVISNALSRNNPEAALAERSNWKRMSFPEVLEKFFLPGRESFVVAGTHGKTTTSAALAEILKPYGAGCFIGGGTRDGQAGVRLGEASAPFVLEGDEYDTAWFDKGAKFLHYRPKRCILTYLEWDHVDIYPDFEKMKDAFRDLIRLIPADGTVLCSSSCELLRPLAKEGSAAVFSYGWNGSDDIRIEVLQSGLEGSLFRLHAPWGVEEYRTPMAGKIYIENLTAAISAARMWGAGFSEVLDRLRNFQGMKRRLENLRPDDPNPVYSDFAHHPTAIQATIQVLKDLYPGKKIRAVFDPRNATSRRSVFHDRLVSSLGVADAVIIGPPFHDARLKDDEKLDAVKLAADIGDHAVAMKDEEELKRALLGPSPDNTVTVLMSCGAFFGIPALMRQTNRG